MIESPIFIIGTERSGSNLLRVILNAQSRVTAPHPPHVVRYFEPLEKGYGPLSDEDNFRRLIQDISWLLRHHIHPWDIAIDERAVLETAPARSAFGVAASLYEQQRAVTGKARWCCKSTFMIDHCQTILQHFPGAQLIFLVRDARDVAASSRRSVFSTYEPYFTAELWSRQQLTGLALLDELPPTTIHLLRYEDLLRDPEGRLRQLCEFLQEPFEPQMLRFFETPEAQHGASLSQSWKNTAVPILRQNLRTYEQHLSRDEVLLVEATAQDAMRRLGYGLEHDEATLGRVRVGALHRCYLRQRERLARLRAELRAVREDRNVWRRWRRDALVQYLRLRRGPAIASSAFGGSLLRQASSRDSGPPGPAAIRRETHATASAACSPSKGIEQRCQTRGDAQTNQQS